MKIFPDMILYDMVCYNMIIAFVTSHKVDLESIHRHGWFSLTVTQPSTAY